MYCPFLSSVFTFSFCGFLCSLLPFPWQAKECWVENQTLLPGFNSSFSTLHSVCFTTWCWKHCCNKNTSGDIIGVSCCHDKTLFYKGWQHLFNPFLFAVDVRDNIWMNSRKGYLADFPVTIFKTDGTRQSSNQIAIFRGTRYIFVFEKKEHS